MLNKEIVKFTFPQYWNNYTPGLAANFLSQTPRSEGQWNNYNFQINNRNNECDYWIVMGDVNEIEKVKVKKATIFITSEEVTQKRWDTNFLNQFDLIITSQEGVNHSNVIRDQYLCPWQIQKSYDQLNLANCNHKSLELSAIISDITWLDGHKKRFAFINKLKGHFKSRLDWFGRGNTFLDNKWNGLSPYKYSIAIENSIHKFYWTEKISDCFLSLTMPFYIGCPNIYDYFPKDSLILLDLEDFEKSIYIIESSIKANLYEENFDSLLIAKDLVLNRYQFFPKVVSILDELGRNNLSNCKRVTIYPESKFNKVPLLKKSLMYFKNHVLKNG